MHHSKKSETVSDRLLSYRRKLLDLRQKRQSHQRNQRKQLLRQLHLLLKADKNTWSKLLRDYFGVSRTFSGSNTVASTVWLIIAGLMLYLENILGIFFDLSIEVPSFLKLENFIYATETALSAIIILFASKGNPFKLAYIVPLYAYVNVLIGNVIMVLGFEIWAFWWYRLLIFGTAIPVYIILIKTIRQQEAREKKQSFKDELLEMYKAEDLQNDRK